MPKIYFDTEFAEGFVKPVWWLPKWFPYNKPKWTVELISIGMIKVDKIYTDSYYAVSKEFNPWNCNEWVKQNVLTKLPSKQIICSEERDYFEDTEASGGYSQGIWRPNPVYKTLNEIRQDVIKFCGKEPEFYAYFADYDWVVFCSNLFGRMIDLPEGFPMYCNDLKQEFDMAVKDYMESNVVFESEKSAMVDKIKKSDYYPIQKGNEHDALADAQWNLRLASFLVRCKEDNIIYKILNPKR